MLTSPYPGSLHGLMRLYTLLVILTICLVLPLTVTAQQEPVGLAKPGTAQVRDKVNLVPLDGVRVEGILGERYDANYRNRILVRDENAMLIGFQKRPGPHPWIGEHVGKWLHATALVYSLTNDPQLLVKMKRVAGDLIATQEADGYLGTYVPENRMSGTPPNDWDVWVHKYDLIGLLSYYQVTHDQNALAACERVADYLINTFGPGKKDINTAGQHAGMAPTSVLEPMVLLYRATANRKYLDFSKTIVAAWEGSTGAHMLSILKKDGCVQHIGNAKAYEMLSCLCGLSELYRVTGDRQYLTTVLAAWDDIVKHHLYLTGTGSAGEYWRSHGVQPFQPEDHIGEVCVTTTWLQLNLQLYRLLGQTRFVDQAERTMYNHLLGAQTANGEQTSYYTPLAGPKPFSAEQTCCFSSMTRGIALMPEFLYALTSTKQNSPAIDANLIGPSQARIDVPGVGSVSLSQAEAAFLVDEVVVKVETTATKAFTVKVRIPAWSTSATIALNRDQFKPVPPGEYAGFTRTWGKEDVITVRLGHGAKLVRGDGESSQRLALTYGPLVLAADEGSNPELKPIDQAMLAADFIPPLSVAKTGSGAAVEFETQASVPGRRVPLKLKPFYAVGLDGSPIEVWFRAPKTK